MQSTEKHRVGKSNLFSSTHSDIHFKTLYVQYADKVYAQCLYLIKDHDSALDCTQDVFLRVFTKLKDFEHRSHVGTWIFAITRNYCLNELDRRKRHATYSLTDDRVVGTATIWNEEQDTRLQQLEAIIHQLPANEQQLLAMRYEQKQSLLTIAQTLNTGEGAIKMRLHRCHKRLYQRLQTNTTSSVINHKINN